MRRTGGHLAPEQRLGAAVAALPPSVAAALDTVAAREDLPLVAGSWERDSGGCLVANVVRTLSADVDSQAEQTLDLRILALLPELSSRDLNRLIVAWDEAAAACRGTSDGALRALLRDALAVAAARRHDEPPPPGGARRRGLVTAAVGGGQDRLGQS